MDISTEMLLFWGLHVLHVVETGLLCGRTNFPYNSGDRIGFFKWAYPSPEGYNSKLYCCNLRASLFDIQQRVSLDII